MKNYEKHIKLFNYSFVIGSGMIVFGCITKFILRAIDANNWGIYDTFSFALPLFPATGIMIVICIALIKLLSMRHEYNIEMNTTQVVIANLYILTSLLMVIFNFILCTMASNLNENYSSSDSALSESEFADSVDKINFVFIGLLVTQIVNFILVAIIVRNLYLAMSDMVTDEEDRSPIQVDKLIGMKPH